MLIKKTNILITIFILAISNVFAQTFTKVETGDIVTELNRSYGCNWIDYNNDGWIDLFITGADNYWYKNNGDPDGTGQVTFKPIDSGTNQETRCGSWGDYNNDGWIDVFVVQNHYNFLFQHEGNGNFTKITDGDIVNISGNFRSAAWGDFDNDGDLDLFVTDSDYLNYLYQNNYVPDPNNEGGQVSFTRITEGDIITDNGHSITTMTAI